MAEYDLSGMPVVYEDTSDNGSGTEDEDSIGTFYFDGDSDNGLTADISDDIVFASTDTDFATVLDDPNDTTYTESTSPTKIHMRHLRIYIRKRNPAFWRHIRNLIHQGLANEAVQEMLNYESQHPPSPPLPN